MPLDFELLLGWLSEIGSGDWDLFKEAHRWLASSGPEGHEPPPPGATAHAFSILGHAEFDWVSRKWACAPPVMTIIPDAGAHALLVGCRTRRLLARFEQETVDNLDFFPVVHSQREGPNALYVATSNARAVKGLADRLAVEFEESVSDRLASLLPTIEACLAIAESPLPPKGYGFQRLQPESLWFEDVRTDRQPGLYKYSAWGGARYLVKTAKGTIHETDRALGIYAELSRVRKNVIVYEPDSVNGRLLVPYRAPLPALQARTAVLCTGLLPQMEPGDTYVYFNVPARTASAIGASLGQKIIGL